MSAHPPGTLCRVNYAKRRNIDLFTQLKEEGGMDMEYIQNYIPIYTRFFDMNPTNCECVGTHNPIYVSRVVEKETPVTYRVERSSADGKKTQTTSVFCKIIPLTDPYKFLTGKTFNDSDIFNLPTYTDSQASNPCLVDVNNNAYVDGMFTHFTSLLQSHTTFVHGVPYYGAFTGVKRNLAVNIYDDLEYLHGSSFFNSHKNIDFQVEDYSLFINDIIETGTTRSGRMPPISIAPLAESLEGIAGESSMEQSASDIGDISYDGLFENNTDDTVPVTVLSLADLAATDLEVIGVMIGDTVSTEEKATNMVIADNDDSSSSCSSRTSCTSDGDGDESGTGTSDEWSDESGSDTEDPIVLATLPRFPVEVIFMEKMDYTLDTLMGREEL